MLSHEHPSGCRTCGLPARYAVATRYEDEYLACHRHAAASLRAAFRNRSEHGHVDVYDLRRIARRELLPPDALERRAIAAGWRAYDRVRRTKETTQP